MSLPHPLSSFTSLSLSFTYAPLGTHSPDHLPNSLRPPLVTQAFAYADLPAWSGSAFFAGRSLLLNTQLKDHLIIVILPRLAQ